SVAWLSPSAENNRLSAQTLYNDNAGVTDQWKTPVPAIARDSTARSNILPANDKSTARAASNATTQQQRIAHAPVPPSNTGHPVSPSVPGITGKIPHPPVPPAAPEPIFDEHNDVNPVPDPFTDPVASAMFFNNHDLSFTLQNDLLNDLVKLTEDAKIKVPFANSRLPEQLRILIDNNMLYQEQLHREGMLQNRKQLHRETPENKAAGKARKDRIAALNNAISFFHPLTERIPDIQQMFTEEKLQLDSIRKASVERAEKQKALWLKQVKEKSNTGENEAPVVYELIVHIDNNAPLRRSTVKRLQQNAQAILHVKQTERAGRTNSTASRKNAPVFTFVPSRQDNSITITAGADDHRVIHAERRQRMVITL
ncbi:MAG TPA: hypothetical protein PLL71_18255, partial [Agriterribacter sp.]|nr:hypothetical protein [Agriterribacter sp.]